MAAVSSKIIDYLRTEDATPIPLSADWTADCIENGTFDAQVQEFIERYGELSGAKRILDYDFVKKVVSHGNYGLLTILIAVANYGIRDVPAYWGTDPCSLYYKSRPAWCAAQEGKKPFDHTTGGLGIAHWDTSNLSVIYSTIGIDPKVTDRSSFEATILTSGIVTNWRNENGRSYPTFSKGAKFRLFDRGLKQDKEWVKWAHDILHYRDAEGKYVHQYFIFRLFLTKYWFPVIAKLEKIGDMASDGKHTICLQDAVRISRAGNSYSSIVPKMVGKDCAEQYRIYSGDTDRYVRQKSFCRRCADIIAWEHQQMIVP